MYGPWWVNVKLGYASLGTGQFIGYDIKIVKRNICFKFKTI